MIAIGAGGLDVAVAMARGTYSLVTPKVINVKLTGKLRPWVSAKDVILYVLQQLSVKGGVGKIVEYTGEGVKTLSVTDRATITNMGAELGATTSVFPSDENTKAFMESQGRGDDFVPLAPDTDAVYDEVLEVNLSELEPLAAKPHSPDNVDSVKNIGPIKIDQVAIGSCTNSSYTDLMKVAAILKGRKVSENVSLVISPVSGQDSGKVSFQRRSGGHDQRRRKNYRECLRSVHRYGAVSESSGVSLRTFNRNFKGRSGTKDADIYLVSPETAAISAIEGVLTTGMNSELAEIPPVNFDFNDNFIVYPKDSNKENTPVAMDRILNRFLSTWLSAALSKRKSYSVRGTISPPMTSCRRIPGFSLIVPMCLIFRIIVSKISTRSSLPAAKPRETASSSAVKTTDRVPAENTRLSFLCIWAFASSWRSLLPVFTAPI